MKKNDPEGNGVPIQITQINPNSRPINIQLTQVSAANLLRFIADLSELDHLILSTGVELGKGIAKGRASLTFRVPSKLAANINEATSAEAFWSNLGVKLPDGSMIDNPSKSGGFMSATQLPIESLDIIELHIAKAIKGGDKPTLTAMEKKLESIIIPRLEVKEVTFEEAVDKLRRNSHDFDPAKKPRAKGVNIIIRRPAREPQPITLSLKNVTLGTAIQELARQAGYTVSSDPFGVILSHFNADNN